MSNSTICLFHSSFTSFGSNVAPYKLGTSAYLLDLDPHDVWLFLQNGQSIVTRRECAVMQFCGRAEMSLLVLPSPGLSVQLCSVRTMRGGYCGRSLCSGLPQPWAWRSRHSAACCEEPGMFLVAQCLHSPLNPHFEVKDRDLVPQAQYSLDRRQSEC